MGKLPFLRPSADAACFHVENPLGYAYKAVESVVESVEGARIARRFARLSPLRTVKG